MSTWNLSHKSWGQVQLPLGAFCTTWEGSFERQVGSAGQQSRVSHSAPRSSEFPGLSPWKVEPRSPQDCTGIGQRRWVGGASAQAPYDITWLSTNRKRLAGSFGSRPHLHVVTVAKGSQEPGPVQGFPDEPPAWPSGSVRVLSSCAMARGPGGPPARVTGAPAARSSAGRSRPVRRPDPATSGGLGAQEPR